MASSLSSVLPKNRLLPKITMFETVALLPYADIKPRNQFTGFTFPVSTAKIPDDPIPYLHALGEARMRKLLNSSPYATYYAMLWCSTLPCFLIRRLFRMGTSFSVIFTTMPTTKNAMTFLTPDCSVEDIFVYACLANECGKTTL